MKRLVLSISFVLWAGILSAQSVLFQPCFHNQTLVLDSSYLSNNEVLVTISTLRFYVSNIQLLNNGTVVWQEAQSHHLVDASDTNSLLIVLPANVEADQISFLLGTDSLSNVSGAMGGDLDPSKGMYWAWNSGYINFKLEGTSPVCTARNNEFQFHLGGYAHPYATVQQLQLPLTNSSHIILVDVAKFLEAVELKALSGVMSPGAQAVSLSVHAATIFSVKADED